MVLGRLPVRYRVWCAVAGVLAFALAGAWLGYAVQTIPSWSWMMAAGTILGAAAVVAFLRTMGRSASSPPTPRPGS